MHVFADSLTIHEVNELSNILIEVRKNYARQNLNPANVDEIQIYAEMGTIAAIKAYRERNNSGLLEAKLAIEQIGAFR